VTLFPEVRQRVTSWWLEEPADFCSKTPDDFGAEVYRKRTGVSGIAKSAAKTWHVNEVRQCVLRRVTEHFLATEEFNGLSASLLIAEVGEADPRPQSSSW
jgi:hypothetical protein